MQRRFIEKKVDRDWLNTNFPCMMACPAHTNAGRYVELIAKGEFEEAYRYAREPNPLASICGRVCAHPCETACRRGEIDKPIAIRALKRFLTEQYGPESRHPINVNAGRAQAKLPFRIAIVGAGPVGLAAAHDLALMGYAVTIFEASQVAGGMLYLGLPEYRLPRDVVEAQVREILSTGDITLKLSQAAGRDFTIADLRRDFDAVLIAVGAHRSRDLTIPGVNLDGVYKGIDFLLNVNLGYRFTIGKKVLVIGGGNVAMDVARSAAREVLRQHSGGVENFEPSQGSLDAVAAREMMDVSLSALRLGAQEVHLVCLETRNEMPAALEEIEEAEQEGIIIHPGFGPKQIIGEQGRAVALEVLKTKSVFDANHRFSPTFYENNEIRLDCDTIIMAIGQAPNLAFLSPEDGVDVSPRGLIAINPQTLMTSAAGVFAGGDCVFGPRLIIDSVADGKRAAVGIDEYLRGTSHPEPIVEVEVLERHSMPLNLLDLTRPQIPMLPLNRRTGVTEVEIGYNAETAMAEAQRCLHCWVNTVFEGMPEDGTECILCGGCVDVCPESCLELVSLDRISFDDATTGQLAEVRDLLGVEFDDIKADELGVIAGSAMLKDESRCIRCGLCAARCPAGTITMESFNLVSADPTGLISVESIDRPLRSKPALTDTLKR
ncbi:FAD-dependent pyridine nucleotide-disulphide oxidoreductase [Candidatus Sulfotelmatomonas gaucii]|uniref:FAD-dependent pyridine nucleotide-disulphide oxidoreductase n=1 Tax=Candidatus Sulfuritelmatomonas gaucii TaxID=2043161 RepID=A0A2N9L710_9BACT|nr:FAD-dependent pyridine nucleotide-disulphide oxidoreductase [Candidatus Sulfotelmatomonas gaucii]